MTTQTKQHVSAAGFEPVPTLALPRVLANIAGRRLSLVESQVSQALEPLSPEHFSGPSAASDWTLELIQTSSVVVLQIHDLPAREFLPDMEAQNGVAALPPLAYSRLWFEFTSDGYPAPYELGPVWLIGAFVTGTADGWTATFVFHLQTDPSMLHVVVKSLNQKGRFVEDPEGDGKSLSDLTIFLVSLINSHGAELAEVRLPRPQRRDFELRLHSRHPRVYRVIMRATRSTETARKTARTYSCRWMVRGHWRTYANGARVWVRAYIKGPAGAPWRGRPVYATPSC